MIINLDNLNAEQNKIFNDITSSVKYDYNNLINNLSEDHLKNIDWIVSSIPSRNKYQSKLFIRCSQIRLIKYYYKSEKNFTVLTSDRPLSKVLKKNFKNIKIKCTENIFKYLSRKLKPFKQFINSFYLLFLRYLGRKNYKSYNLINKEITLIDTFIINNSSGDEGSIKDGKYIDRYYPGMLDYINSKEKKKIFFLPTLIGFKNPIKTFKEIRSCDYNFIIPDDFLQFSDYIFIILFPFRNLKLKLKNISFDNCNLNPLLNEERISNCFDFINLLGLLYYRFSRRFSEKGIKVRLLIDWYENQVIDRGLIKGFHDFFKNVPVYGYQGYIISKNLHIYTQPNYSEYYSNCVPDKVLVTGKGLVKNIKEFCELVNVDVAPGFRFRKVHNRLSNKKTNNEFSVLIGLPISIPDSKLILERLINIYKKNKFNFKIKFYIKPHPTFSDKEMKNLVDDNSILNFKFLKGDFHKILNKVNLIVSNASSICLEALTKRVPVIIIAPKTGIIQNPIPSDVSNNIWKISYNDNELIEHIKFFYKFKPEENFSSFDFVKNNYFEKVSKKGVLKFLNL